MVPLRLRPLRMARLARQCLVRLTDRTDTPHTRLLRSFSFRLRSATATRVLHLRSWALYLTAGAGPHPACCTGIGYRRTLLNPILTLRKHDAHPEDAPQRLMVRPGTLDAFAELVLHRHSLRSQLFSLRSGVSLLFAFDTLLPLSPFYAPLPPLHRSSTSPEHKIPAELSPAEILSHIEQRY